MASFSFRNAAENSFAYADKTKWLESPYGTRIVSGVIDKSGPKLANFLYEYSGMGRSECEEVVRDALSGKRNLGLGIIQNANEQEDVNFANHFLVGLHHNLIVFDKDKQRYRMPSDHDDLTGLMWQVALTNWDTTKKELSTPQVATMAKISLQSLGQAVFPSNASSYSPEQVNKALGKVATVLGEFNERMKADNPRLAD